jgi:hypothetical protein
MLASVCWREVVAGQSHDEGIDAPSQSGGRFEDLYCAEIVRPAADIRIQKARLAACPILFLGRGGETLQESMDPADPSDVILPENESAIHA